MIDLDHVKSSWFSKKIIVTQRLYMKSFYVIFHDFNSRNSDFT